MNRETLCIDLDDTLVKGAWPDLGEWLPGAQEALYELQKVAHVVIFSSRFAPVGLDGMTPRTEAAVFSEVQRVRTMLDSAGLTMIEIWTKPWKPRAVAYVDDRAVHYVGKPNSWKNLVPKLVAMCGVKEEYNHGS